ncbi:hypothetical protein PVAP13_9NG226673 [Panicum virgatum]|uniref:Uncharacterized protein n=1 Tax=Panicum virgatum TaxID=38727 RepID=A0A8T0MIL6_PANVG|nr:hypothetical protein PVAP13_9NG226673 [Panicum virgatum]
MLDPLPPRFQPRCLPPPASSPTAAAQGSGSAARVSLSLCDRGISGPDPVPGSRAEEGWPATGHRSCARAPSPQRSTAPSPSWRTRAATWDWPSGGSKTTRRAGGRPRSRRAALPYAAEDEEALPPRPAPAAAGEERGCHNVRGSARERTIRGAALVRLTAGGRGQSFAGTGQNENGRVVASCHPAGPHSGPQPRGRHVRHPARPRAPSQGRRDDLPRVSAAAANETCAAGAARAVTCAGGRQGPIWMMASSSRSNRAGDWVGQWVATPLALAAAPPWTGPIGRSR